MKRRQLSAIEALPPELVAAIQEHVNGCYLWVPSTAHLETRERDAYIVEQWEAGVPVKRIARTVDLSPWSIYKIVQRWKKRQT